MGVGRLPDEIAFLGFRQLLEVHHLSVQILATINATLTAKGLLLRQGAVIDGTPIAAPPSTRNSTSTRDPEMCQTKRGNQRCHGMEAHAEVDADSRLLHSIAPQPVTQ